LNFIIESQLLQDVTLITNSPFVYKKIENWALPLQKKTERTSVGFEVFTAVVMKSIIFWVLLNGLHSVISQKMILLKELLLKGCYYSL
jgi:hypothetical protein